MKLSDFEESELGPTRLEHPDKAWRPMVSGTADEAVVVTQPLASNLEHDEVMRANGYPPEEWELVGAMNFSRRQLAAGGDVTSYRFKVKRRANSVQLPTLFAEAAKTKKPRSRAATLNGERALVVGWSDTQTGKTGSRGGTPELVARVLEKRDNLADYIAAHGTTHAVFADAGDSIESFENTSSQLHTNDLSLMDQIDVESTLEQKMIELLAQTHASVDVASVGSNHCAWRSGKGNLGKPTDDWGIFIKRQLKKAFELNPSAYGHVKFFEPREWEDALTLDVLGHGLGISHGHQVKNSNAIPDYWAGHTHGAGPLAEADILLTGHFHHLRVQPSGRSRGTKKSKWWLQLPTLDNGSDWYRNLKGDDSDPGLVVFVIDAETGFDLTSLAVL